MKTEERLEKLSGKKIVDFQKEDILRLFEQIEFENNIYGLNFERKIEDNEALLQVQEPILKEYREKRIEGMSEKPTHLLIEGDNLLSLTALLKEYKERISVMIIDPPYFTGNNDFLYKDNFYQKEDKYKYSSWLSFLEKRLVLAKELLSEEGVIFIHVDDKRQAHLKLLCDTIFGESNFESFIWKKKGGASNTAKIIGTVTEHILCYFKKKQPGIFNLNEVDRIYTHIDEEGIPYNRKSLDKSNIGVYERPTMIFPIIDKKTGKVYEPSKNRRWTVARETAEKLQQEGRLIFEEKTNKVFLKYRPHDYKTSTVVQYNFIENVGSLSTAKNELKEILGNREIFDTPKPTPLLKHLLKLASKPESIVMDFFAGSGTLGQAVMELNKEDNGKRTFILCTNNENNICKEITFERIKRIAKGYINSKGKKIAGTEDSIRYFKAEIPFV